MKGITFLPGFALISPKAEQRELEALDKLKELLEWCGETETKGITTLVCKLPGDHEGGHGFAQVLGKQAPVQEGVSI